MKFQYEGGSGKTALVTRVAADMELPVWRVHRWKATDSISIEQFFNSSLNS